MAALWERMVTAKRLTLHDLRLKKKMLVHRDGPFCYCCGMTCVVYDHNTGEAPPPNALTVDHIIPKVAGGSNDLENLAVCCLACNAAKGHNIYGKRARRKLQRFLDLFNLCTPTGRPWL